MDKNSPATQVIRVRYSKTGKAKYISHLDLMTTMQRAFIRAGVSLKYSEGFNPHPHISVALPASVGVESLCELMDVSLLGSSSLNKINNYLPDGLKAQKAYRAFREFKDIKWVEATFRLHYDTVYPQNAPQILTELFAKKSLFITKKTKRGVSEFDAAPHIRDVRVNRCDCNGESCVEIKAGVSAQNPTISYKDIACIAGICCDIPAPDNIEMKRIDIYDANMVLFK